MSTSVASESSVKKSVRRIVQSCIITNECGSKMSSNYIANVPTAPEDPILGINVAYNADPSTDKLNLGVGAYRTEEGQPLVLNVVRKVTPVPIFVQFLIYVGKKNI